jgi:hypothetical protein
MPPLVLDSSFHSSFDVITFTFSFFIHVNMPLRHEVVERTIVSFLLGSQC